jgi:hypothetical protein
VVELLTSNRASFMTASDVPVDGGMATMAMNAPPQQAS